MQVRRIGCLVMLFATAQKTVQSRHVEVLPRRYGESHFYDLTHGVPDISPFGFILERFQQKAAGRIMPAWRDFKIQDLVGWHADMILIEVLPDQRDGHCRIVGDRIGPHFAQIVRQNRKLSDSGSPMVSKLLQHFDRLLSTPAVAHFNGRIDYEGKDHVSLEMLDLPLADKNGTPRYVLSFGRKLRTNR